MSIARQTEKNPKVRSDLNVYSALKIRDSDTLVKFA